MPATTYRIDMDSGLFDDLNVLLIALSGITIAVRVDLGLSTSFSPGDYATAEAKHVGRNVRLPIVGPITAARMGAKPAFIEVTAETRMPATDPQIPLSGLDKAFNMIFAPFFTNYFEKHIDDVRSRFGASDTTWPPSWQMAWVVRNAVSHNGRVWFKSARHPPVSWQGLVLSPKDNGTEVIGNLVTTGDLVFLLLDMETDRTGVPLPIV